MNSIKNKNIRLFNKELNKVWVANTKNSGKAVFKIPMSQKYFLGLDNFYKYKIIKVDKKKYSKITNTVYYQPSPKINEIVKHDTIYQTINSAAGPNANRVLVTCTILGTDSKALPNEYVFFDEIGSSRVFAAKTDNQGKAIMLIPKGEEYTFNLTYERDINFVYYPLDNSLRRTNVRYAGYLGSKNIEKFYKTNKRNLEGFQTEFMSREVTPELLDPLLVKKTEFGFHINFNNNSPSSGFAAIANQLLVNSGYYSSAFFSLNNQTGESNWGIRFAEGGPSAAVVEDGVLLIVTESCTLYAIDINNGKLLWSKWLGPFMYHTPTVANGKVIACYPNDFIPFHFKEIKSKTKDKYSIIAFDLHTGDIKWQNWMDSEFLGAPVYSGNNIFTTTLEGTLYAFDEKSGKLIAKSDEKATCPPTINGNSIFVCLQNPKNSNIQELAVLESSTLKIIKRFNNLAGYSSFNDAKTIGASALMNFQGSRVLNFDDKNYNILNGNLLCSNPQTGEIIWQSLIEGAIPQATKQFASNPISVGGKIIISTLSGKILIFDKNLGNKIQEYNLGAELTTEPVVHNGWIYCGTRNGHVISFNTKDKTLSGWNMFGKDASHNMGVK